VVGLVLGLLASVGFLTLQIDPAQRYKFYLLRAERAIAEHQ
jgi:hypothetical protein